MRFGSMRIIEDPSLVDAIEDWSRVRSPSRARRRLRYGHRQNIDIVGVPKKDVFQIGDTFVMHPAIARELRATLERGEAHEFL